MMTFAAQLDWPLEEALRWPAKMIDEFAWERDLPDGNMMGMLSRRAVWKEPIGVIGAIVPWNYPLEVTLNKLGPILATGNTTVLKPAPDTPWNATRLGRLVAEKTDIPPGVVNVVTSSDHLVGEELTLSPLVDMISFTGSTATGTAIMEKGAADAQEGLPRARWQVGHDRLRRRRLRLRGPGRVHGVHPRRPGLRHADADAPAPGPLRRGRRAHQRRHGRVPLRRPEQRRRDDGPAGQRPPA